MRTYKPPKISNATVLTKLDSSSTVCKPHIGAIRKACRRYLRQRGSPSNLTPLNLDKAVRDELYEYYKAKRVRDDLQWIRDYREAEGFSHCPLCGNCGPTQLEHYLPRSPYAEFTIFSWNLLPSCSACNLKRSNSANAPGTTLPLIHPYFDSDIYGQPLLTACIRRPLAQARFEPMAIATLPIEVFARADRHIKRCVSQNRFHEHLSAKWEVWRGKASSYKTLSRLSDEMELELKATCGPMGFNSWDAAFFRAVLADGVALRWLAENPQQIHGYEPFAGSA